MITEDHVSFEIAKLLKEKGFNKDTYTMSMYDENGEAKDVLLLKEGEEPALRPAIHMAMKWLREAHNIDISVSPHSHKEGKAFDYDFVYWNGGEYHMPYEEKRPTYHELFGKTWEKYEEACEAAIKYCLENLI